MNRFMLFAGVLMAPLALAHAHHSGGQSNSGGSSSNGECVRWAAADGGIDAGSEENAEAADAGMAGLICVERSGGGLGCSIVGFGVPFALLALAPLRPRLRRRR